MRALRLLGSTINIRVEVLYITRGSAALGDVIVLAVTVVKTAHRLFIKERDGIRVPLSHTLLRDGEFMNF